jgi:YidC/Oxa1 family membrane protein insertase
MLPFAIKQQKHSIRQATLRPKEMAIRNKYKGRTDQVTMQKMQQEIQEFYQKEHYSPYSGCLSLIIQMPIIMGLFALLRNPMMYMSDNNSDMIFAFHEDFMWIADLAQPDPWILPIIAGVATFVSFSMTQALNKGSNPNQMAGMMKMMQFVFPIMILWMAKSFPSGLALYWAVSQFIQIFFNIHLATIRKKLKKESEAKKKGKKSKK